MSGSFGSLRFGRTESAAFNATVAAPGYGHRRHVSASTIRGSAPQGGVNTYSRDRTSEDAIKVVYTSPNFNGLTIGMSYAPEAAMAPMPAGDR